VVEQPVRVGVNGAAGRMGTALCRLLADDPRFVLLRAVVTPQSASLGVPVPASAGQTLRYASGWDDAPALDVVIDFSSPAGLDAALAHCLQAGVALVAGSTGYGAATDERLRKAAGRIALLRAANFSLGVAVMRRLLREAAAALPDWDVEIVEAHHRGKRDARSGTALDLGAAVREGRGVGSDTAAYVFDRTSLGAERMHGTIGMSSIRGGDLAGEHMAMLMAAGERLELIHRATDRAVFARGALHAAYWLSAQPPGLWSLEDVLARPRAEGG
jgi:4-hydroxy-tetrahydrodipicolinate reductase